MKRATVLLALAGAAMAQPPQVSSVKMGSVVLGKVRGEDASAIGSAWVTIMREANVGRAVSPDPKDKVAPFSQGQGVRPDGTFGFTGLEAGTYRLCASHPGTTWLNSCEWPSGPDITLKIGAEQLIDGIVLTMRKGVPVNIRLNDPGNHLSKNEKSTPGAHILLGVGTARGRFRPATVTTEDAAGRDYSVLVPAGTTVDLVFYSGFFKLQDHRGNDVPAAGTKIPVTTDPAGAAPRAKVVLAVTGLAKP